MIGWRRWILLEFRLARYRRRVNQWFCGAVRGHMWLPTMFEARCSDGLVHSLPAQRCNYCDASRQVLLPKVP